MNRTFPILRRMLSSYWTFSEKTRANGLVKNIDDLERFQSSSPGRHWPTTSFDPGRMAVALAPSELVTYQIRNLDEQHERIVKESQLRAT
jgi:hypothetical protein